MQLKAELQEQDKHWRELEAQWGSRNQIEVNALKQKLLEVSVAPAILDV